MPGINFGRFVVNVFSKKFLSCLVLALSLGKSAEAIDPLTIAIVISSIGSIYTLYSKNCCCKRRNGSARRIYDDTKNVDAEVFNDNNRDVAGGLNNVIGNRPEVPYIYKYDLCSNDDCSALGRDSSYSGKSYTRDDINNYYKNLIKDLMKNNEELSNKGLSVLNSKEISKITYVSKDGLWVCFGEYEKKFELGYDVFEFFEHSLSNRKYDNFGTMIESCNPEMAKLFRSKNKKFVPVKADNCDCKWEVSPERRVLLKRNGGKLATDDRFRIVKLTINNRKSDNILTAQKATVFFIVELNKY